MRSIPALVVPFRMIRAEYLVLRALPLIASLNPISLVEGNRRNLVRPWLGAEIRVLLFDLLRLLLDLLHLLRVGLLCPACHVSPGVLLAGCRNCRSGSSCRRCWGSTGRCLGVCGRRLHSCPALL